ncbi:MAG: 3-deoxy-8-phosphooctulonate synthase [Chitinophagales bacterium]|nr:3-deoxy-8-phosphooctulonate synthase [Chitinophagales bacterium]MDW8394404.1 3-deoxy-8-phosphooctulonate synthase [Chitinophagales bacterium]
MVPADIPKLRHYRRPSFLLIAGPCVVEEGHVLQTVAEAVGEACEALQIPWVFKASYRKANRTRGDSFTGIGDEAALEQLAQIGSRYDIPVLTDIHEAAEAAMAAAFVDVLQIPAFLCRQTELLQAAGRTGKWVNIKKGQFLAADQMAFAAQKVEATGNHRIMLTERGTMFGYGDLVVDFRSVPIMQQAGYPVIVDCTHSVQQPNQTAGVTGGMPRMIEPLARAALAVGADGLFLETHPEPAHARSDGANMLPLRELKPLLQRLRSLYDKVCELYPQTGQRFSG